MLSTWLVTSLADDGSSGTLRWAINQGNSNAGNQTVSFDPSLTANGPATIALNGTALILASPTTTLTIHGPGANLLTIDAQGNSGVIFVDSAVTGNVDGVTITGGVDDTGGGIDDQGTLTVSNSSIVNNSGKEGGGLEVSESGHLTILNSTISGNYAGIGGGIHAYSDSTLTVVNTTISGNEAQFGGGITAGAYCNLTVTNCTISGNLAAAGIGGGIYSSNLDTATIEGTIAAKNNAGGSNDLAGTFTGTYNLIGDGSGGLSADPSAHNILGTTANPIDPLLSPLGDYGGPTPTMEELPGSPALGTGSTFDGVDGQPITTDQRGMPRGPSPDIGGFQDYAIPLSATSGDDTLAVIENGSHVYAYTNFGQPNQTKTPFDLAGLDEVTITSTIGGNDTLELNVPDAPLKLSIDPAIATEGLSLKLDSGKTALNLTKIQSTFNSGVLILDSLTIGGSTDNWSAQLDINSADIIVRDGSMSDLINQVRTGYDNDHWDGNGIVSSTAATLPALKSVGIAAGSDFSSGMFDGAILNSDDVVLSYTYTGDANLDGKVDSNDYALINNPFNLSDPWHTGDFNYNGVVNSDDYAMFSLAELELNGSIPTGPTSITQGDTYTLTLPTTMGITGPITSWSIDWGDGSAVESAGAVTTVTHQFATAGVTHAITATASGSYTFEFVPTRVAVTSEINSTSPTPIQLDLSWAPMPNVDYYEIYRDTDPTFSSSSFSFVGTPVDASLDDFDGLIPATTYYYKIYAVAGENEFLVANSSATTISGPGHPMDAQGSSSSGTSDYSEPLNANLNLKAIGVNDSEILITWDSTAVPQLAGQGWLEMSSNGGTSWTIVNDSSWGAYNGGVYFAPQTGAFLVRNLQRYQSYMFKLHFDEYDLVASSWVPDPQVAGPVSAQVVVPQYNNIIYLVAGASRSEQSLFGIDPRTGKYSEMTAYWWQLVQDGYNAYMSADAGETGSVFTWNGYGFGYQEIQNEVQNHRMTNVGLIGYSHGGGLIYNLVNTLKSNSVFAPYENYPCFAGTIDAVVRDQSIGGGDEPLTHAPGGAASNDINYFQPNNGAGWLSFLANVHGTVMSDALSNTQLNSISYKDANGNQHMIRAAHTNIYLDQTLFTTMIQDAEQRIQQFQ